jgi:hypothetical protein
MTTRSSSSSSLSEAQAASSRARGISESSQSTILTASQFHIPSPTNTIDDTSFAETTTVRSSSPAPSQTSTAVKNTAYDAASVATTTRTGSINAMSSSQQPSVSGIPIIRPPVLQSTAATDTGVFGAQRPVNNYSNPSSAIRIDVAAAQQQYQQRADQSQMSSYSKI